jgi:AcrR family transcriptional regulator
MQVKSRKQEQSEATKAALISVARGLFAEKGYADTSTEEIVQGAGVTRGALYHHFRDKEDLFEATFEQVETEVTQRLMLASAQGATGGDQWQGLLAGVRAFLEECRVPEVQQIVLLDAPSVLGWQRWREIEAKYGFGLVKTALQGAMDSGLIARQPVDPLAHMLLGALTEAGMMTARARNDAERAEIEQTVTAILGALRTA